MELFKGAVVEQELISSRDLAKLIGTSLKFVETHRNRIVGSQKIGGLWRFRLDDIRKRISVGKDIIKDK